MASRNSKSKSSGLRMLWIPGGRKSHPKGRFDSTNKHMTGGYGPKQKKSEVWSLGGGRAQRDLLNAEPDTRLLDGPTTSARLAPPIAGAIGVVSTTTIEPNKLDINSKDEEPTTTTATTIPPPTITVTTSTTDIETTPVPLNTSTPNSTEASTPTMPAKTINTTTAEIMDENRFSILGKDILEEFDLNDLPSVPKEDPIVLQQQQHNLLNTSSDTTKTAATTTPSSPKSDTGESNKDDSAQTNKKLQLRNNNNNKQVDINSIESISDNNIPKPLNTDFAWIDELYLQHNGNKALERKKRKERKKHASAKKMDQLDGVPTKQNTSEPSTDEDEKVVKCLYYTLMCCDCSIS